MKIIGIDGGGTSTRFTLFDENGTILHTVKKDSVHILNQEKETCIQRLKDGVSSLDPSCECVIAAGLAGYGQQEEVRHAIEDVCRQAFGTRRSAIYSDVEIAIAGALNGEDGIVLIAGTGSIGEASVKGKLYRCGGWGFQLGDEGSGFWIAEKMFHVFVEEADGRRGRTLLYNMIMDRLELDHDYDIITKYMKIRQDRAETAKYAQLCYEAAKASDPAAIEVFQQAADELSHLAIALSKHFSSEQINVCLMGGICEHMKELLVPELKQRLTPYHCVLSEPAHNAEYGAYLLGRKLYE
jgi:N-acetylglucosamine kinase-like BadF-type ATPase